MSTFFLLCAAPIRELLSDSGGVGVTMLLYIRFTAYAYGRIGSR